MNISHIRRKSENLIVRKRLPSYLKKEKIRLTKEDKNGFKKNVKYHQVPQFVQDIKKFTNKYTLYDGENQISKNRIIYINNLFNEVSKNKNILTSNLICDLFECLYKLNYFNITVIINLFSILINNTLDFSNITGYVKCDFTHLLKITNYLFHFQSICNKQIQNILSEGGGGGRRRGGEEEGKGGKEREGKEEGKGGKEREGNIWGLKIVDTYLKEFEKNRPSGRYDVLFQYVWKSANSENVDILIYSLLQRKNQERKENMNGSQIEKKEQKEKEYDGKTVMKNYSQENSFEKNFSKEEKHTQKAEQKEMLLEHVNSINKLTDMFNFLLNKILTYFNENTGSFSFSHLRSLFFCLGIFQKCDASIIDKISNRLIEEIENKKTNRKFIMDEEQEAIREEVNKNSYANKSQMRKSKKKFVNTYSKIDSKEFLILPYTIGMYMNSYFNNYLIEYINVYILSLINSRINCDIIQFMYCLVGYKHIMLYFFILYNIIVFKERCQKNANLLKKYQSFIKQLNTHKDQNEHLTNCFVFKGSSQLEKIANSFEESNLSKSMEHKKKKFLQTDVVVDEKNRTFENDERKVSETKGPSDNNNHDSVEFVYQLLLKEFQININNMNLINFRKNCLSPTYTSDDAKKFYLYYRNLCKKVYNYSICLLNKYEIKEMIELYKKLQSLFLNDLIIKNVYVEVLYEKLIMDPNSEHKSQIFQFLQKQKMIHLNKLTRK